MAGALLLLGCNGPSGPRGVLTGPAQQEAARLDTAVADLDAARAALLAAPDAVVAAATALDAADAVSETGDHDQARQARTAARPAVTRVAGAFATIENQVEAYRSTLRTLQEASAPLEQRQRQALMAATTAGEQEAAALAAFLEQARAAWPGYAALDRVQSTWLDRASAGWYRTTAEAAGGYVVLRLPVQQELDADRATLARADRARRPATQRMRTALAEANRALDLLRAPAG